eukprot:9492565-Pyramimonas_sp.AAC.1
MQQSGVFNPLISLINGSSSPQMSSTFTSWNARALHQCQGARSKLRPFIGEAFRGLQIFSSRCVNSLVKGGVATIIPASCPARVVPAEIGPGR